jgi:hypothetical protein
MSTLAPPPAGAGQSRSLEAKVVILGSQGERRERKGWIGEVYAEYGFCCVANGAVLG